MQQCLGTSVIYLGAVLLTTSKDLGMSRQGSLSSLVSGFI